MTNYRIPPEKIREMIKEADDKETVSGDISNVLGGLFLFYMIAIVAVILYNITIPESILKIICYSVAICISLKIVNVVGKLVNSSTKQ
jgi:hypothetical protein